MSAMYSIAIIGAGQLGSRHLQALARLALPCWISVVDLSAASLQVARERFAQMPANPAINGVDYYAAISQLPGQLDYVIVATTADVRLRVIESLLAQSQVKALLLEKVLFQRLSEYQVAKDLIKRSGVQAWVNCLNRVYPVYTEIRQFFAGETLRYFQVRGGQWGLGCNGIHYLDILGFMTGAAPECISTDGVDGAMIPSKRENFKEFTGVLRGSYSQGAQFEIVSLADTTDRLQLTFRSDNRSCVFDELTGAAAFFDAEKGGGWVNKEFRMPYLSEVGTEVATEILTQGSCGLTSFEESLTYHLPFIQAMGAHAAVCGQVNSDSCPIT